MFRLAMALGLICATVACEEHVPITHPVPVTLSMGGPLDDLARAVAYDNDDGFVVVGTFSEMARFGGGLTLETEASSDGFVARYAADGTPDWSVRVGGGVDGRPSAVRVAADGTVVVGGSYRGEWRFGSSAPASGTNAFIAGLDGSGVIKWSQTIMGAPYADAVSLALGSGGTTVALVKAVGPLQIDQGTFGRTEREEAIVVALDSDGEIGWVRSLEDTTGAIAVSLATDPANGEVIVLLGAVARTPNAPGALTGGALLVTRLSPTGETLWRAQLERSFWDGVGANVTVGSDGAIFVAASVAASCVGDCTQDPTEILVTRLSSSGAVAWERRFQSTIGLAKALGIAANTDGSEVSITGYFGGTIALSVGGAPEVIATEGVTAYLLTLGADGDVRQAASLASTGTAVGHAVARRGDKALVVGSFSGEATANGTAVIPDGGSDAFVIEMSSRSPAPARYAAGLRQAELP